MKKLYLLIPILFLIYLGCEDEKSSLVPEDEKSCVSGEVELWGDCYSIENTDSLSLASSNQVKGLIDLSFECMRAGSWDVHQIE